MKLWRYILLAALLAIVPVLSACDLTGAERARQDAYQRNLRQALEEYQKQQEEYQKQQEAYQKALAEGLEEYLKAYQEYQQNLQEQQLKELQEQQSGQ